MRELDGPLRIIGKDRDIEVNADVSGVFNRHVEMQLLAAVHRNVR